MKNKYLIILLLVFLSCSSKKEKEAATSPSKEVSTKILTGNITCTTPLLPNEDELKLRIIKEGDIDAYNELTLSFMAHTFEQECLPYSLIMANKYDYSNAYYDVYLYLTIYYYSNIAEIDSKTADMAIEYLILAAEKGNHQAIKTIERYSIKRGMDNKDLLVEMYD